MEYLKDATDNKTALTNGAAKTVLYILAKFAVTRSMISARHIANVFISTSLSNYAYMNYVDISKLPAISGMTLEVPVRAGLDTIAHNTSEMVIGGSETWKQTLIYYSIVEVALKVINSWSQ